MESSLRKLTAGLVVCATMGAAPLLVRASDHLDTPTVIADPAADIGDLYGWMSPDGLRLNLVMNIVGKQFSDRIAYVFHVDSGRRLGKTRSTTMIDCRFDEMGSVYCEAAGDHAAGIADRPQGIESERGLFRVFAGLRDDPFANNVQGTRQAYQVAEQALKVGIAMDGSGCPAFAPRIADEISDRWRHTDGGPAKNFLADWKTGALVVSIDVNTLNRSGPLLAVWAGTYAIGNDGIVGGTGLGERLDRVGRTLTGNALLGPLEHKDVIERRKEHYNRASPQEWASFAPYIQRTLGLYDALDGRCGNQWHAAPEIGPARYSKLARLLADDRLWVDTRHSTCQRYMAVETGQNRRLSDCGGRTPDSDAIEVYRSLLVNGTESGVDDGVPHDDKPTSITEFPFLAES